MQTPKQDGFFMPGEFEAHRGCILIWPSRPGSWRNEAREAKKAFAAVIEAIARSEAVFLAARKEDVAEAKESRFRIRLLRLKLKQMMHGQEISVLLLWYQTKQMKEWCVQ